MHNQVSIGVTESLARRIPRHFWLSQNSETDNERRLSDKNDTLNGLSMTEKLTTFRPVVSAFYRNATCRGQFPVRKRHTSRRLDATMQRLVALTTPAVVRKYSRESTRRRIYRDYSITFFYFTAPPCRLCASVRISRLVFDYTR